MASLPPCPCLGRRTQLCQHGRRRVLRTAIASFEQLAMDVHALVRAVCELVRHDGIAIAPDHTCKRVQCALDVHVCR